MRLRHKVIVKTSRDAAQKNKQFWPDEDLAEIVTDNYARQVNGDLNIAASATENLPFGDVTLPKGLYLEVDQDVTVNLNGSADGIQLRRGDGKTAKLFIEADLSQVTITAPTATVSGVFCIWGDPL
jgi:hypothetical protein